MPHLSRQLSFTNARLPSLILRNNSGILETNREMESAGAKESSSLLNDEAEEDDSVDMDRLCMVVGISVDK